MKTVQFVPISLVRDAPPTRRNRLLPKPSATTGHVLVICGEGVSSSDAVGAINLDVQTQAFGFSIFPSKKYDGMEIVDDLNTVRVVQEKTGETPVLRTFPDRQLREWNVTSTLYIARTAAWFVLCWVDR